MTIKEFARLCGCTAQTLRYYDKIDLLKPVRVDPWSGYRYYGPEQAITFVKIKNLQAADFSIQEIKGLLAQSDGQLYAAFEAKIAEQTRKLAQIRKIQQSYLAEKSAMEQIIYSMTDYILSQCNHPEVLTEFGLSPADAPQILALLRQYLNSLPRRELLPEQVTMTVNGEVFRGQAAVLERIAALTRENLTDTILLNDGFGHEIEEAGDPEPDFSGWDTVWEERGWGHVYEFMDRIPPLQPELEYCLWVRAEAAAACEDLSFAMFFLGAVLNRQYLGKNVLNCAATAAEAGENHFKLLCRSETQP